MEGLQVLECARAADVLATLRAAAEPDLKQIRLWSAFFTLTIGTFGLT